MEKIGQAYRSGIWTVRAGKIEEFIRTWQLSVDWMIGEHPAGWGGEAFLLQDNANPHEFISCAWSTMPEKTEELLAGTEFQAFMASMQELCEEIKPHRMHLISYRVSQ